MRNALLSSLSSLLPAVLPALLLPTLALAQARSGAPPEKVVDGAFGIGFTNQYFFRGLLQENQGVIAQPWFELGYGLYEGDDLRSLNLTFGLWNSLHDGPTGGANGIWYESDFHVGLNAEVGERLEFDTRYTAYHSPNGAFGTVEEVSFAMAFDDRKLLFGDSLDSGLQPSVLVAIETDGQRDAGNHVGIYAQFGIEPSFHLGEFGPFDLTLALPAKLGLSLSDYYEDVTAGGDDEAFGFLDLGAVVSTPLTFLPARMGLWTADAGVHWILLGDNNEERNIGDTSELIVTFGMGTSF